MKIEIQAQGMFRGQRKGKERSTDPSSYVTVLYITYVKKRVEKGGGEE